MVANFLGVTTDLLVDIGEKVAVNGIIVAQNVESISGFAGAGNDSFIITRAGYTAISGGEGDDTLYAAISADQPQEFKVYGTTFGTLLGYAKVTDAVDATGFDGFEHVELVGGSQDDVYTILGNFTSQQIVLNGGGGLDRLGLFTILDDPIRLIANEDGTVDDNLGAFSNFEAFTITSGGGDDVIATLSGVDQIDTAGGNDTVSVGDGADVVYGEDGSDRLDGGSGDDLLSGGPGDDILNGGDGDDYLLPGVSNSDIRVTDSGDDQVDCGDGNDAIYFGQSFDTADRVDGGSGFDQLGLQGNYWAGLALGADNLVNVEQLVLLPGGDTRFGDISGKFYSYNLTTDDANVAAGQRLVVTFNTLRTGENVLFNGSAESDGWFLTYAGLGTDAISGGQQDDGFFFGTDGSGNGLWGVNDKVDGQGGSLDQLGLQGNYTAAGSGAVVFGAGQLTGIEVIVCLSGGDSRFGAPSGQGYSYALTMNDGNVGAGQTLYISANTLKAADGSVLLSDETLTFDGSAESDGRFVVYSGNGADTIVGGAGGDTIYGGGGADRMTGGGGGDVFAYVSAAHSTAGAMDQILDFATGDSIDLHAIDAVTGGSDDPFAFVGSTAFSHTAGELRAFEQTPSHWQVEGDVDGDGVADLVIALTTDHALTGADFVL